MPLNPPQATRASARTDKRAQRLVKDAVDTAHALLAAGASIGDLKIVAAAMKEMRDAFAVFAPYHQVRKVSCFGSARTKVHDPTFRLAEHFSRRIADAGFMVITGAGSGIMEACQRGAGRERSFGINVSLPFEQHPNRVIHGDIKLVSFKYFFTRKLFFIKEAHAVALFPGGFGTHDEGFEVLTLLQTGKCQPMPLVLLDHARGTYWKTWHRYIEDHLLRRQMISADDLALYRITNSVDEAVDELTSYYRVYHSSRYVHDLLVVRLNRQLPPSFVEFLAADFRDLITDGTMEQRAAFPVERDDPDAWHLPRLAFRFDRTSFGRLRMLINRINAAPVAGPQP